MNGKKYLRRTWGLVAIFMFAAIGHAQEPSAPAANKVTVKIKNFGQMDDRFYRGAQPDKKDYKDLAALGIKKIGRASCRERV